MFDSFFKTKEVWVEIVGLFLFIICKVHVFCVFLLLFLSSYCTGRQAAVQI